MYYEDLTPYEYGCNTKNVFNIGWLEKGHEFPTGDFPEKERVLYKLKNKKKAWLCKGSHECDFCEKSPYKNGIRTRGPNGNGEYRFGKYSAPALIRHYIKKHNYKPPQEFIDAVINSEEAVVPKIKLPTPHFRRKRMKK